MEIRQQFHKIRLFTVENYVIRLKKLSDQLLDLGNDPGAKKFLDNLKSSKFVAMSDKDYDVLEL